MNGDTPDAPNAGTRAVNLLILWKLVIFELFVSCAITAGTFYLATMPDDGWSGWTPAQRYKFLVGMVVSVLVVIKAFTSKSFANLSKGNLMPPDVDGGNTQTWTRRQVDTVQTISPPPPAPATPPPAVPGHSIVPK
jgi:hypothetical protein